MKLSTPSKTLFLTIFALLAVAPCLLAGVRNLTFFVASDTHYGLSPAGTQVAAALVEKMNKLPGASYPPIIGGIVGKPRGVIHIGDITNSGRQSEWDLFVRDYGLSGSDDSNAAAGVHSFEVRLVLEYCDRGSLRDALDQKLRT